jgi:hypothetical protein
MRHWHGVSQVATGNRNFLFLFSFFFPADMSFPTINTINTIYAFRYLRALPHGRRWAIDMSTLLEGEKLTLFLLTKTDDEQLLNRKIKGAEAMIRPSVDGIVDNTEQTMNKSSTTRKAGGGGQLTVTADISKMIDLVDESGAKDGDT